MGIRLNCRCGRSLHLRDDLAGLAIRCPQCQKILQVPDSWLQGAEAAEGAAEKAARSRSPRAASRTAGSASSLAKFFVAVGIGSVCSLGLLYVGLIVFSRFRAFQSLQEPTATALRRFTQNTGLTPRLPVQSPRLRPDSSRGRSRYLDFQNWAVRSRVFPAGS